MTDEQVPRLRVAFDVDAGGRKALGDTLVEQAVRADEAQALSSALSALGRKLPADVVAGLIAGMATPGTFLASVIGAADAAMLDVERASQMQARITDARDAVLLRDPAIVRRLIAEQPLRVQSARKQSRKERRRSVKNKATQRR